MSNHKLTTSYIVFALLFINGCLSSGGEITNPNSTSTDLPTEPVENILTLADITPSSPETLVTPSPISSKEDSYQLVENLIKHNENCQLPCWWGITPGVSSSVELHEKLLPLSDIADIHLLFDESGSIDIQYPKKNWLINIVLSFTSNETSTLIETIVIRTNIISLKNNTNRTERFSALEYQELFETYSLDKILSTYGQPANILIRADVYDSSHSPETFEITLLYPKQGIFVRYTMLAEKVGNNIGGCPAKSIMELWLLSPDDMGNYQQILSTVDPTWEGNFPYSKSVSEVTSMTIEDFYQTFKEPTNRCVDTPLIIWPNH